MHAKMLYLPIQHKLEASGSSQFVLGGHRRPWRLDSKRPCGRKHYASHMHALHYVIYKQDLDLRGHRTPTNRFGFQQGTRSGIVYLLCLTGRHPLSLTNARVYTMIRCVIVYK